MHQDDPMQCDKKEEVNLSDREINKWKIYLSRQPKGKIIVFIDIYLCENCNEDILVRTSKVLLVPRLCSCYRLTFFRLEISVIRAMQWKPALWSPRWSLLFPSKTPIHYLIRNPVNAATPLMPSTTIFSNPNLYNPL